MVRHPGIYLKQTIEARELSCNQFAKLLNVPANRISELVAGRRAMTAETALKLETVLGHDARFWMQLQSEYDLDRERQKLCSK